MAPKRPIEEEEEDGSSSEEVSDTQNPNHSDSEEEEEESSSEDEREKNPVKRSSSDASTADDADADDADADDDVSVSDTTASAFTIKPSKPNPNPNSAQSILAPKSSEQKKGNGPSEQKKVPMTWTEDGEAAVLEGFLEFRRRKGVDPSSNWDVFYLFVKKTIPFDVTKSQVIEKIRRLRRKYADNVLKGDGVVFAKPRDAKLFELSKKVWGGDDDNSIKNGKRESVEREGDGEKSVKKEKSPKEESLKSVKKERSPKKAKKEESLEEEVKEVVVQNGVSEEGLDGLGFWERYPLLKMGLDNENFGGYSEEVKKVGEDDLSRIGHAKAKELEGKWKLYRVKEAELKMMWLDIVREQTKLVIEELAKP